MLIYKSNDFIPKNKNFTAFPCAELRTERRHSHDFYELAYVYDGNGLHYDGREFKTVSQGSFILISPGMEHYFISPENNNTPWLMVYDCLFLKTFFEETIKTYLDINESKNSALYSIFDKKETFCLVLSDDTNNTIMFYIEAIKHKCIEQMKNTDIIVKNLLLNILMEVEHIYNKSLGVTENTQKPLLGIEHLTRYINANLDINLNLDLLAAQIHMSPSYLSRYFKQMTGKNISEYITEQRIKKAQDLLLSTTHSITDVCFLCGYSSIANFRKYFSKYTGLSPREYRKVNGKR